MIPQETVQQILDTAQIVDVVSDFVALKRRGANWVACCPFHNEKTPSFYVSPAKGLYKCFGCGKAGSAVGFVMEHEHYSYVEALRYLARKYHIEIVEEELTAEETARRQRNESLLLVSEFAQKFFAEKLLSGEGKDVAMAYYRSRALEDETIRKFGLGWAPSGRDELLSAARAAGYKDEYLLDAGLVVKREDGSLADKFRERVMFPIHSVSGRVIGFSGRTLRSDNPAKYMNSPDTPIYTKSNILFGIWFAKGDIARRDKAIVVEGNVDLVMLHQLGITNVVAPCGTSFTVEQVRLIRKFTENVTLMFDGDSAGVHAALRAIDMVLSEGMNVHVVRLPSEDDPDSFARSHSLEEFNAYIGEHEQDFLDFKSDILLADAGKDPLRRANMINELADTVARIPDAVKRSVYVRAAAEKFEVEEPIISQRVHSTRLKLMEDARKEREREQRMLSRQQDVPPVPGDYVPEADYGDILPEEQSSADGYVPENKTLAPVEEDILRFLLEYGTEPMEFPSDSKMAAQLGNMQITVTEFISDYLSLNSLQLVNSGYRQLYDAYMAEYDAGFGKDEIVRRLTDSPQRLVARLAAGFSTKKYRLTVKNLASSMTATSSWLVQRVPRTMHTYTLKLLENRIRELRHALPSMSGEQLDDALITLKVLQDKHMKMKSKLMENS